jgi:hypothetical protein
VVFYTEDQDKASAALQVCVAAALHAELRRGRPRDQWASNVRLLAKPCASARPPADARRADPRARTRTRCLQLLLKYARATGKTLEAVIG